eukprot:12506308-Heterocapsa_arctica.AAC.1
MPLHRTVSNTSVSSTRGRGHHPFPQLTQFVSPASGGSALPASGQRGLGLGLDLTRSRPAFSVQVNEACSRGEAGSDMKLRRKRESSLPRNSPAP